MESAPQTIAHQRSSQAPGHGAWARGVQPDFVGPGNPVENAFIESFNGNLRDECLKTRQFRILDAPHAIIEGWWRDDNKHRPHGALGHLTPRQFAMIRQGIKTTGSIGRL